MHYWLKFLRSNLNELNSVLTRRKNPGGLFNIIKRINYMINRGLSEAIIL